MTTVMMMLPSFFSSHSVWFSCKLPHEEDVCEESKNRNGDQIVNCLVNCITIIIIIIIIVIQFVKFSVYEMIECVYSNGFRFDTTFFKKKKDLTLLKIGFPTKINT